MWQQLGSCYGSEALLEHAADRYLYIVQWGQTSWRVVTVRIRYLKELPHLNPSTCHSSLHSREYLRCHFRPPSIPRYN